MRKAIYPYIRLLLCCILAWAMLVACQDYGKQYYYRELEKIDHRENRELARREIMALKDEVASYPDYIKMYHQLLITELNEEVKPCRNMKVARALVEYYEKSDDIEKLLRSYVIAGDIFANCSDGPKAIEYYHRAENLIGDKDSNIKHKLYLRLAGLLVRHNMVEEAQRYANRVGYACQKARDTLGMIKAKMVLCDGYKRSKLPGIELDHLQEALRLADESGRTDISQNLRLSIAQAHYQAHSYHEALRQAQPLIGSLLDGEQHRLHALLSQVYFALGQNDSAYYYAQKVMDDGNSVSKRDTHLVLSHICIQRGDRIAAEDHLNHYIELNNELNHIENSEAIAQADAFYHNQKQTEENAQLRNDNQQKQIYIILIVALLIVLLILFVTYIQRHRRRQELMALRIQQLDELRIAYKKTDEQEHSQTEQMVIQSGIYQRLATMDETSHPSDEDWQALANVINQAYERFMPRLLSLCRLSTHEYHVCLLLKAGFEPVRIASLTLRSKAAVSTVRSRLYEKAFGKKGSAKDWDEVIRTL